MRHRIVSILTSVLFYSMCYAQLAFSKKRNTSYPRTKESINAIIHNEKNEKLNVIAISNAVLQKIHEYGDYGPCINGQTTEINKSGILI